MIVFAAFVSGVVLGIIGCLALVAWAQGWDRRREPNGGRR